MDTLRALSIRQPWAGCITSGRKDVENRTWGSPYRGPVAIHTGTRADVYALADPWTASLIQDATRDLPADYRTGGAYLAVARLADVHPHQPGCCGSQWAEQHPGVRHWVLADVRRLPAPILARGRLGLWTLGPDLTEQITAQLRAAASAA